MTYGPVLHDDLESIRLLLRELLFQTLNTENSSDGYVQSRLALAGLTQTEIDELIG